MPTDAWNCPEALLPDEAILYLQERQERMLRENPLGADVGPRFDTVLKFNQKEYRCLVRQLLSAGILGANAHFRDPPGVELLSSEGLARIELPLPAEGVASHDDLRAALEVRQFYIEMADVKDCFHRFRIDPELSRCFCLPPLKAGASGVAEMNGEKPGLSDHGPPLGLAPLEAKDE
ncbi:unnamed protein product, partial [Prorocentrum cordatum]